jgi:hypothetical protein
MARMNVNPNRMELSRLKKRLVVAKRGHKLLKDKQDALIKAFLERAREGKVLREELETELAACYKSFLLARAQTLPAMLEQALMISGAKCDPGSGDPFDCRVVGKVDEHYGSLDGTGLSEVLHEKGGFFKRNAHGGKNNGEIFVPADNRRLAGDLCRHPVVWKSARREYRQLLTPDHGVHSVNGRNPSLDELRREIP